jgi:hypothetical protein
MKSGEQIPFDVAGTRTVYVDHQDLDSADTARQDIAKQIAAVEKKPADIETPISVSIDLQNLKRSADPERRSLGDLLTAVSDIRTGLANVEKRLDRQVVALTADRIHQLLMMLNAFQAWESSLQMSLARVHAHGFDDPDSLEELDRNLGKFQSVVHRGIASLTEWLGDLMTDSSAD